MVLVLLIVAGAFAIAAVMVGAELLIRYIERSGKDGL